MHFGRAFRHAFRPRVAHVAVDAGRVHNAAAAPHLDEFDADIEARLADERLADVARFGRNSARFKLPDGIVKQGAARRDLGVAFGEPIAQRLQL